MDSWDNNSYDFNSGGDPEDSFDTERSWEKENDIYDSLQRAHARDDLFGIDSGRGILGDMQADRELAHDIASGMDVRDALMRQRAMDDLFGEGRSHGILNDMLTDDLIARDVENGMDIGEAISKEEFWADTFDDLFNG